LTVAAQYCPGLPVGSPSAAPGKLWQPDRDVDRNSNGMFVGLQDRVKGLDNSASGRKAFGGSKYDDPPLATAIRTCHPHRISTSSPHWHAHCTIGTVLAWQQE
jgi:hypothetical protein